MKDTMCSVPGCGRGGQLRRGWCNTHYKRWSKTGDVGTAAPGRGGTTGVCAVEDCANPSRTAGAVYCEMHYARRRRTGSLDAPAICSIDDCEKPTKRSGMCSMHNNRVARHGSPHIVITSAERKLLTGPNNPRWLSDEIVDYRTMHQRVARRYGVARRRSCADCGKPAVHWSYDHADPNGRETPAGVPYSTKLEHYRPLCASCHKYFDHAFLQAVVARRAVERILRAADATTAAFIRSQISDDGGLTIWPDCDTRWLTGSDKAPKRLEAAA
jgi:hypothetical protein